MWVLLAGIVVSLLPRQYRNQWSLASTANFRKATVLSGLAEAVVCLLLYAGGYLVFIQHRVGTIADAAMKRGAEDALASPAAQYGAGYVSLIEYVFSPLSLLLCYFALEGTLRTLSAAVTEETHGTLPLYVLAWGIERVGKWRAERALGSPVADEVQCLYRSDFDLAIASCRQKTTWDRLLTIEFEELLYELAETTRGSPPRPFVYWLRKIPPGKLIRALHHYQPDEVLPVKKR